MGGNGWFWIRVYGRVKSGEERNWGEFGEKSVMDVVLSDCVGTGRPFSGDSNSIVSARLAHCNHLREFTPFFTIPKINNHPLSRYCSRIHRFDTIHSLDHGCDSRTGREFHAIVGSCCGWSVKERIAYWFYHYLCRSTNPPIPWTLPTLIPWAISMNK